MKQTAVEWLIKEIKNFDSGRSEYYSKVAIYNHAYRMEKEQMGYTKEDVLKAGEMGEINHHDTKHILSYLDEAKQYNKTFKANEK